MPWNNSLALALICGRVLCLDLASMAASAETTPIHQKIIHKKKYVMGAVFEIVAYGESPARVSKAVDQAFQEIVRLDEMMSDYKADSALTRLNQSAALGPQTVPPDLYSVIEQALRYSRLSGGKFDVTVGPLVSLWKAVLRGDVGTSPAEEARLRACVGYQKIELVPTNRVQFRSPCVRIDLGAIGKGYALDRAADVLRSRGISSALLNAGGSSILSIGAPPGQAGWLIHLRDPSNRIDPQVMLSDYSISTSEQTPPSLLLPEAPGHIIDPDTGAPVKTKFAVSAVAKTATESDAMSTTLLLIGPEKGSQLIKTEAGIAAIWVSSDGQSKLASSGPRISLPKSYRRLEERITTNSGTMH